jgi:hypothetical protein
MDGTTGANATLKGSPTSLVAGVAQLVVHLPCKEAWLRVQVLPPAHGHTKVPSSNG